MILAYVARTDTILRGHSHPFLLMRFIRALGESAGVLKKRKKNQGTKRTVEVVVFARHGGKEGGYRTVVRSVGG